MKIQLFLQQEYSQMKIKNSNFALKRLFLLIVLFLGWNIIYCNAQITYKMQTRLFDYEILNSYPQKVISIDSQDSIYNITLQVVAINFDSTQIEIIKKDYLDTNYLYSKEISSFLQPTSLINHQLPEIRYIRDTLFKDETNTLELIRKGLLFTTSYITTFDDSLAKEIDKGICFTLDIPTILERRKGTCSEYANLFIALMRSKGIPCRFITGYVSYPPQNVAGCHAWAECYIKNLGWLSVDPQSGQLAYPIQIKLFAGKDYEDCKIRLLKDIVPSSIEITDNKYPFN